MSFFYFFLSKNSFGDNGMHSLRGMLKLLEDERTPKTQLQRGPRRMQNRECFTKPLGHLGRYAH